MQTDTSWPTGPSALLTDLYQLTMAYGYWKNGMQQHEAVFHLFFRKAPFKGNYAVACGLEAVIRYLEKWHFSDLDRAYLAELKDGDGQPLFAAEFLEYLSHIRFTGQLDAMPEGTWVFPDQPLLRIQAPLIQAQLLETILLNYLNFATLIATKAARICQAAQGDPVLEFGLRRAQGPDGALTASRAAYIGGCAATSNVLAGRVFGIPVRGTHAHSWVLAFEDEPTAFEAYASAMPGNVILLVDTFDTLAGVEHAIVVGNHLRAQGKSLRGIRLDSGDLVALSQAARQLLDESGFADTRIVASNDLDEYRIQALKDQGANIQVWGVGTRLITAFDQAALGGVYKLSALRAPGQPWQDKVKRSEETVKSSTPGLLQVRRLHHQGQFVGDQVYDLRLGPGPLTQLSGGETRQLGLPDEGEDVLIPIFDQGKNIYQAPSLAEIRAHVQAQATQFGQSQTNLAASFTYPHGLETRLANKKSDLLGDL